MLQSPQLEPFIGARKEMHILLTLILRQILEDPKISWSLVDAIDMLMTMGYSSSRYKLKYTDDQYSEWGRAVIKPPANAVIDRQSESAELTWQSVASLEKDCLREELERMKESLPDEFFHPCNQTEISVTCALYCSNLALWRNNISHKTLLNVMKSMNHPSKFEPGKTWSVPFCFQGKQVGSFRKSIRTGNYQFNQSEPVLGQTFCTRVKQTITDIGPCTTFNGADIFSSVNFDSDRKVNSENNKPPIGQRKKFEEGIFLLLDSFGYRPTAFTTGPRQHLEKRYDHERDMNEDDSTPIEPGDFSSFRVLLHSSNEIAQFLSPDTTPFMLSRPVKEYITATGTEDPKSRQYFLSYKVKGSLTDQSLRGYQVAIRECRFRDETDGFEILQDYTEDNCRFECKHKLVTSFCGCIPWFFLKDNQTNQMCDLLGNKCYEQTMLTTQIDFETECNCYPGCEDIKYVPVFPAGKDAPDEIKKNDLLLLQKDHFESPSTWNNASFLKKTKRDKFLTRYILDYFKGKF